MIHMRIRLRGLPTYVPTYTVYGHAHACVYSLPRPLYLSYFANVSSQLVHNSSRLRIVGVPHLARHVGLEPAVVEVGALRTRVVPLRAPAARHRRAPRHALRHRALLLVRDVVPRVLHVARPLELRPRVWVRVRRPVRVGTFRHVVAV